MVMLAGLVIIPVIYKYKWDYYYDQVSGIVPIVGGWLFKLHRRASAK